MCNFPSCNFPKDRLGTLRRCRLQWGQELRLGWARGPRTMTSTGWGLSAVARTELGICCLGNWTFGKLPFGKNPLKKLPNISDCLPPHYDCLRPYSKCLFPYSKCLFPYFECLFPYFKCLRPNSDCLFQMTVSDCLCQMTVSDCVTFSDGLWPSLTVCVPTLTVSVPTLIFSVPTLTVSNLLWFSTTFPDCLCPESDCFRPYSYCLQPSLIFNNLLWLSVSQLWLSPSLLWFSLSLLWLSPTFSDFQQPSLSVCVPTLTVSFTPWLSPSLYGCLQPSPTVSVTILTVFISIFLAVFVPTHGLLKLFSSSQPSLLYDQLWLSPSFILLSLVFSVRGMDDVNHR